MLAREALHDGLINFDQARGFRGPVDDDRRRRRLGRAARQGAGALRDVPEWRLAVVLGAGDGEADDRPAAGRDSPPASSPTERETGAIPLEQMKWAKRGAASPRC